MSIIRSETPKKSSTHATAGALIRVSKSVKADMDLAFKEQGLYLRGLMKEQLRLCGMSAEELQGEMTTVWYWYCVNVQDLQWLIDVRNKVRPKGMSREESLEGFLKANKSKDRSMNAYLRKAVTKRKRLTDVASNIGDRH